MSADVKSERRLSQSFTSQQAKQQQHTTNTPNSSTYLGRKPSPYTQEQQRAWRELERERKQGMVRVVSLTVCQLSLGSLHVAPVVLRGVGTMDLLAKSNATSRVE